MSTSLVIVKVGTTVARVNPENVETVRSALIKASKVPSVKQAHARALMGGSGRKYPRFVEGISVEQYVTDYYSLNISTFGYLTGDGMRRAAARDLVKGFFQPLSTLPMFTPDGATIEEALE